MDELFEILLEIILEGALELSGSRRVPLPLRIIAGIITAGVFGGVIFLLIFGGISCLNNTELTNNTALAVLMFIFAGFIVGTIVWKTAMAVRNRRKFPKNNEIKP